MKKITIDPKHVKSYKTEANLEKALDKLNLPESIGYLQVMVEGRFTAVFTNSLTAEKGIYMNHIIHSGFMVVG